MAAPPSKSLRDLNGKWVMNKTLSDDPGPGLALQGIGWLTRKAIGLATVTLHVKEYEDVPKPPNESKDKVTHVDIAQTATGGVKGTTENRCLDNTFREHSDWLFGKVKGRTRWAKKEDIGDLFLLKGWEAGQAEFIVSHVESIDSDWTATQAWGFQDVNGQRRYCRNVVIAKGSDKYEFRLVYDFVPE